MKRLYLYGDSNTYGYVWRGMYGDRYPEEIRWTEQIREALGEDIELIEDGLNGRPLPSLPRDERKLKSLLQELSAGDLLLIMLGTNDIALVVPPDEGRALAKMEDLLSWLKDHYCGVEVLVLAPPCVRVEHPEFYEASLRMNAGFRSLCLEYGVHFEDTESWHIDLASDGIHFSEEGHQRFAEKLKEVLSSLT